MENYQQKINDLLRKARAQGVARAVGTKKSFITNIVVTPKEELKSLKDIWRNTDILDSKNPTSTFRSRKTGKSTIDSPGSDQSSDTSPLKNVNKTVITNYFQRMKIKTGYTDRSEIISPNFISPDIICSDTVSRENEYTMVSSAFSENSSFISDENGDILMTSAVSSPNKQVMILTDDEEMSIEEGESPVFKVTKNTTTTHIHLPFSPKVTLDKTSEQKPDHRITPPNRNASVVGYFQKGKRKQRFTEFVTGDKLNDISPDTLRILAAAQSNGEIDHKYEMKNPFII